jgi:hypothetical protein
MQRVAASISCDPGLRPDLTRCAPHITPSRSIHPPGLTRCAPHINPAGSIHLPVLTRCAPHITPAGPIHPPVTPIAAVPRSRRRRAQHFGAPPPCTPPTRRRFRCRSSASGITEVVESISCCRGLALPAAVSFADGCCIRTRESRQVNCGFLMFLWCLGEQAGQFAR